MKKLQQATYIVFLFAFAMVFLTGTGAFAADKKVVQCSRYSCKFNGCDMKEVYTFAPDDITANNNNFKVNYQQNEWFMFFDPGKPIKKCKSPNEAHFFELKERGFKFTPADVFNRRDKFIVLKSGNALNTSVQEVKCILCGKSDFWSFKGDDMGMSSTIILDSKSFAWNMKNGSQIDECNGLLMTKFPNSKAHIFKENTAGTRNSIDFAKMVSNSKFYYSK